MSLRVWFRRIRELEVLNEELRSALKLCLKQLKGFKSSGTSPLIFRPHLRCLSTLNVNTVGKNTSAARAFPAIMGRLADGTLMVGYHAAFPSSLPTELKKSDKKAIKAKMCQVLLLEYMLWMFREISAKFNKTITSEELVAALEDAPTGVFKYLTDSFAQFRKFNGKPSYVASKPVRYILRLRGCDVHYDRIVCDSDKTILHIIVLALHVTSFNVDLTLLAQVCSLVTIRLEYSVIDLFVCRI
jgi:hypothetical protein